MLKSTESIVLPNRITGEKEISSNSSALLNIRYTFIILERECMKVLRAGGEMRGPRAASVAEEHISCHAREIYSGNVSNNKSSVLQRRDEVLSQFSFKADRFVMDQLLMVAFIVAFYTIGYVGLSIRVYLSR